MGTVRKSLNSVIENNWVVGENTAAAAKRLMHANGAALVKLSIRGILPQAVFCIH